MILSIKDETLTGKIINEIEIQHKNETISVKDLITLRVTTEVESYNSNPLGYFKGLIQPNETEVTLNGYKLNNKLKKIDTEKQVYLALDAFTKNTFILIVNDKQMDSLNQKVKPSNNLNVSFIKLTPLVGG